MQQVNLRVKGWGRLNPMRHAKEKTFGVKKIKEWLCNLFEMIS
jgi:hypothetical protein